jgi:CRP-like cAMP-binding protein
MDEFKEIRRYVANYIQLTTEEEDYLISLLRITKVKKRQCIVQPEFTCKYRSYVLKGAMRAYLVDNKAQTHTIAFAIEDWWIGDLSSYINQEPATLFVEALEDSILIQIDHNSEQLLLEKIPKFERFFRIIAQRSFTFLQKRMLSNLSKTAEERYDEFVQKYPAIVNRVPQYALASYLGFSTVFLSKIRNKKAK